MAADILTPAKTGVSTYRTYLRIEQDLRTKISTGHLAPGAMLPGRRDLATEYGVDRSTIQRALAPLVADGTLITDGTRGTFVSRKLPSTQSDTIGAFGRQAQLGYAKTAVKTIGIIVNAKPLGDEKSVYGDPWYNRIVSGVERRISSDGQSTRFAGIGDYPGAFGRLDDAVTKLVADGVGGIVLIDIHGADKSEEVHDLIARFRLPIVYVAPYRARCPVPHVYHDQEAAGFFAADHLVTQGRRKIMFLAPVRTTWSDARAAGAEMACKIGNRATFDIFRHTDRVLGDVAVEHQHEVGYDAALVLFRRPEPVGAIVAENDRIAYGVIRAARECGLELGVDVLVIGFDDWPESRALGLTTMHPPLEVIGEEAGRLISKLTRGETVGLAVRTTSHLVQRESSGK